MAGWTDYAALMAALASGKAFTDEKAQALAENVAALAEGAPGAPRLFLSAFERLEAGDSVRLSRPNGSTQNSAFTTVVDFGMSGLQAGSVRVKFNYRRGGTTLTVTSRVAKIRGGVETVVQSFSTTSTTAQAASVDVPDIQPGDQIVIQAGGGSSVSSISSIIENPTISVASGISLWPPGWTSPPVGNPTVS